MPSRFHRVRESVNTQSSKSRDQACTGFIPNLLTRYKKLLMPSSSLKMHLESLTHFIFLPISLLFYPSASTDVQLKRLRHPHISLSLFAASQARHPNLNSRSRQPAKFNSNSRLSTQWCSTRTNSFLTPPSSPELMPNSIGNHSTQPLSNGSLQLPSPAQHRLKRNTLDNSP